MISQEWLKLELSNFVGLHRKAISSVITPKWRGYGHVTHFKFSVLPTIALEWLNLETSNFVHWFATWSISLGLTMQG